MADTVRITVLRGFRAAAGRAGMKPSADVDPPGFAVDGKALPRSRDRRNGLGPFPWGSILARE